MTVYVKALLPNSNDVKYGLEMDIVKVFSPGEFLVNISPGITGDQEAEAFKDLKDFLGRRLKSEAHKSISQHPSAEDEIVAVQQDDGEWRPFWHMCYNLTARGDVPEGLFLDNGLYTEINGHRSVKFPCEIKLPMRFKKVILNNLVSTERCLWHAGYPLEKNSQKCLCKGEWAWPARAVQFVRTWAKKAHKIYVIPHKTVKMQKYIIKIFGVVVLVIDGKPLNLNQFLIDNNFCTENEERFLEIYPERSVADQHEAKVLAGGEAEPVAKEEKKFSVVPLTEDEFEKSLPEYFKRGGSSALDEGARARYKSRLEGERNISFGWPFKATATSTLGAEATALTSTQGAKANNVGAQNKSDEPRSFQRTEEEQEASLVNGDSEVAQELPVQMDEDTFLLLSRLRISRRE